MIYHDVIIVGGGPAGSTCARILKQAGMDVLVLDKQTFPRHKLCAGWITPKVFRLLHIDPSDYPFGLTAFKALHFYIRGRHIPVPTRQYAIRRYEFDDWLLKRSGAPVHTDRVMKIECNKNFYTIDKIYQCRLLIGAGGTACPVYRTFFKDSVPRDKLAQITSLELEFPYPYSDDKCRLWFFDKNLPGYSWYVPKKDGFLNIGIGGKSAVLKTRGETIQEHWENFIEKLIKQGMLDKSEYSPKGYAYYLGQTSRNLRQGNAFIIGDSAGLATIDMGEGIGPAIKSGIRAAQSILSDSRICRSGRPRLSAAGIFFPW
jgi:flavin-dependent dehydrogenase